MQHQQNQPSGSLELCPGIVNCAQNSRNILLTFYTILINISRATNKLIDFNATWAFERIRDLGRLFDYNDENANDLVEFQEILDRIDVIDGGTYDVPNRIQRVCDFLLFV